MPAIAKTRPERLRISHLARRSGVKLETIRYYERIGVLPAPPRTGNGHRAYDHEDVRTLAFVRHAREAGFTLADIRILLRRRAAGGGCCAEVRSIASNQLEIVERKIADLVRRRALLDHAIARCSGLPDLPCPVIEMLERPL